MQYFGPESSHRYKQQNKRNRFLFMFAFLLLRSFVWGSWVENKARCNLISDILISRSVYAERNDCFPQFPEDFTENRASPRSKTRDRETFHFVEIYRRWSSHWEADFITEATGIDIRHNRDEMRRENTMARQGKTRANGKRRAAGLCQMFWNVNTRRDVPYSPCLSQQAVQNWWIMISIRSSYVLGSHLKFPVHRSL